MDDEKTAFKAFVGIDFGTDGSGLAYTLPDGSSYIHNMWDDSEATMKPKTSVLFDNQRSVIRVGTGAQDMYLGCKDDKGWKLFERFKMHLYEQPSKKWKLKDAQHKMEFVELKEEIATTNNATLKESSSTVFIAQLQHLKEHAFNFIDTHLRRKLKLKGNVDDGWTEIQYFLTVPAIWSDKAKDKMVQWATEAGLITGQIPNQLRIVYEPDCASLSIQHAIFRAMKGNKNDENEPEPGAKKKKKKKLKALQPKISINVPLNKGDKYILLDVGGGTCDVACHEVVGEFAIAEVLHPSGGKWGATYIDEKFTKLLSELFSQDLLDIFQMNALKGRQSYLKLLNYFLNEAKISYYAKNDDEVSTYHDIQMPSNFVRFVVTQYMIHCEEGSESLDFQAGLIKLNIKLQKLSKKYKQQDIVAPKADANIVANPNDNEDEGASDNDDGIKDKYKDRDWMIKIIEADDDDEEEEYEEDYLLSMHNDVWENLFNTIVNPIIKHCKKILSKSQMKAAKYLFLVGGFANSKYFQMRMKNEFGKYKHLSVIIPELPGLCVVDGASRYGLGKHFVKVRRLPKTYGIRVSKPKEDLDLKKFPSGFVRKNTEFYKDKNADYVTGCFSILVKKGDAVNIDAKPIKEHFEKSRKNQTSAEIVIYSSPKPNPMSTSSKEAKKLGSFNVDLPRNDCKVVVEFIFSSNLLTVYAYPHGQRDKKKQRRVQYL
eukprot:585993_1